MATPERHTGDRLLAALVEGAEPELGERCFERLVQTLAESLGVSYLFFAEPTQGGSHLRTRARRRCSAALAASTRITRS
jgi:hypothetical protein